MLKKYFWSYVGLCASIFLVIILNLSGVISTNYTKVLLGLVVLILLVWRFSAERKNQISNIETIERKKQNLLLFLALLIAPVFVFIFISEFYGTIITLIVFSILYIINSLYPFRFLDFKFLTLESGLSFLKCCLISCASLFFMFFLFQLITSQFDPTKALTELAGMIPRYIKVYLFYLPITFVASFIIAASIKKNKRIEKSF